MKKSRHTFSVVAYAIAISVLSGCGDSGPSRAELQRQRDEAQQRAQREQEGRHFWQTMAVVGGLGGVALLVIGTALGSKARRDAERRRKDG